MELEMTGKVSVIVPVHNVERYLEECILSCVNQTWKNLQIILVDDGSTDGSDRICDYWAEKDERILAIHKQNEGVSKARNVGLMSAEGEYICFIDGDDIADCQMIETALGAMKQDIDLVMWGYRTIDTNNEPIEKKTLNNEIVCLDTDKERAEYISRFFLSADSSWAVWNRLFRKNRIDTFSIRFPEHIQIAEDLYFNFCYLSTANKIVTISEAHYDYRIRSDSAMGKAQLTADIKRVVHVACCMKSFLKERTGCEAEEQLFPVYLYRILENEHERVSVIPLTDYPELREEIGENTDEMDFFKENMKDTSLLFDEFKEIFGEVKTMRIMNLVTYVRKGNYLKYRLFSYLIKWYSRLRFWSNPLNWTQNRS